MVRHPARFVPAECLHAVPDGAFLHETSHERGEPDGRDDAGDDWMLQGDPWPGVVSLHLSCQEPPPHPPRGALSSRTLVIVPGPPPSAAADAADAQQSASTSTITRLH